MTEEEIKALQDAKEQAEAKAKELEKENEKVKKDLSEKDEVISKKDEEVKTVKSEYDEKLKATETQSKEIAKELSDKNVLVETLQLEVKGKDETIQNTIKDLDIYKGYIENIKESKMQSLKTTLGDKFNATTELLIKSDNPLETIEKIDYQLDLFSGFQTKKKDNLDIRPGAKDDDMSIEKMKEMWKK